MNGASGTVGWIWNPIALPGLLLLIAGTAMAALLLRVDSSNRWNRILAFAIFVETVSFGLNVGFLNSTDDREAAMLIVFLGGTIGSFLWVAYFYVLQYLDSPLVAPLRTRPAAFLVWGATLLGVLWPLLSPETRWGGIAPGTHTQWVVNPGSLGLLPFQISIIPYVYALVASGSAYLRSSPGSLKRKQYRAFLMAFGFRDATIIPYTLYLQGNLPPTTQLDAWIFTSFVPVVDLVTMALLAYGVLKSQLFGIDVSLKINLGRAASVLPAVLVFAGSAGVAASLSNAYVGLASGTLAAGVLLTARGPSWRWGSSVADALMPNVPTADVSRIKLGYYREIVEGKRARGPLTDRDRVELDGLRRRNQISPQDAALVELEVEARHSAPGHALPGEPFQPGGAVSRFRIERRLGVGAFGEAWLARDPTLDTWVVLKRLRSDCWTSAEDRAEFLLEARALAQFRGHPHIVQIHDVDESRSMFVMEYLDGGRLSDLLESRGRLPLHEVVRVGREFLLGLARVHEGGYVHRDVKPSNILMKADGTAKLGDFGLARPSSPPEGTESGGGIDPGGPRGTLRYMSPEQVRGLSPTARSDVYAAGAVIFEMATGTYYLQEHLLRGSELVAAIQERDPPWGLLRDARVAEIVRRCLEKDPRLRFADGREVAAALSPLQGWAAGAEESRTWHGDATL